MLTDKQTNKQSNTREWKQLLIIQNNPNLKWLKSLKIYEMNSPSVSTCSQQEEETSR